MTKLNSKQLYVLCEGGNLNLRFGIPKSILYDHSKGKLIDSFNKPGVEPSLTDSEEQSLLSYMKYMAGRGQPLTKSVLKQFVIAIIKKNGRPTSISMQ